MVSVISMSAVRDGPLMKTAERLPSDARQRVAQRGQDIAAFQDCQVDLGQQRGMQRAALAVADQDGAGIGRGADGARQADADRRVGYLGDVNTAGFEYSFIEDSRLQVDAVHLPRAEEFQDGLLGMICVHHMAAEGGQLPGELFGEVRIEAADVPGLRSRGSARGPARSEPPGPRACRTAPEKVFEAKRGKSLL